MKLENFKNSINFRVLCIGFLILLLLIPVGMVESVIVGRGHLYRQTASEISGSWGKEQLLSGPILTIPYIKMSTDNTGWSYDTRYRHIRSAAMKVYATVETRIRYRSIYKVPVYTATVHVTGHFDLTGTGIDNEGNNDFRLDEPVIQIPVKSSRSIKEPIRFVWNDEAVELTPERVNQSTEAVIFSAMLPLHRTGNRQVHKFEYQLVLTGSEEFSFISSSQKTDIRIDSNWISPAFFGLYLPASHDISDNGFSASWEINDLFNDPVHDKNKRLSYKWFCNQPRFGIRLFQPVDTYQAVTRAVKYAVLFIGLTFLIYFFTELFGRVLLHPIQYLFVGMANCIFYLLLLSLAEHINFNVAYFISACASIILISLYSINTLKSRRKALNVFAVLSILYACLFVTLRSEEFALLIGSIGLFAILGLAMYLTRNIDWRKVGYREL